MRKLFFIFSLVIFSCNNKKVELPQTFTTHTKEVLDQTMVYIFFETDGKDTMAVTNRKNTVSTTNWIFNIDKRLKMKHIVPELIKLQKKRESVSFHKNENAKNYFAYSDTLHKNWSFIDFTKTKFLIGNFPKPENKNLVEVQSNNSLIYQDKKFNFRDFKKEMNLIIDKKLTLVFNKNINYQDYIEITTYLKKDLVYPILSDNEYFR